jgi:hypothetical protein
MCHDGARAAPPSMPPALRAQLAQLQASEAKLAAEVEALQLQLALPAPRPAASTVMQEMPTEARAEKLVNQMGRRQGQPIHTSLAAPLAPSSSSSSSSSSSALPPSLNLSASEASALMEVMADLKDLPTPALAHILARMREQPGSVSRAALSGAAPASRPLESFYPPQVSTNSLGAAAPPHHPAMRSGRARLLRSVLIHFFQKHHQEALPQVDELVWRVVGDAAVWSEQELIAKL